MWKKIEQKNESFYEQLEKLKPINYLLDQWAKWSADLELNGELEE